MSARILIVPGSVRLASFNRRLAAEAARMLSLTDATVTAINLVDYPLPIYSGDEEAADGPPPNAVLLAQRLAAQDGLLIVSPEYNASIPPLLKNSIDWISRVRKVEGKPIQPFKGLIVGLAAASPGRYGGLRALEALRPVLRTLGAEVLTQQCTLARAGEGFDGDGRVVDDFARSSLEALVEKLLDTSRALGRHG